LDAQFDEVVAVRHHLFAATARKLHYGILRAYDLHDMVLTYAPLLVVAVAAGLGLT
jgi:hypothetical protein